MSNKKLDIRPVRLRKPKSLMYLHTYNIYKDKPCYAHCYHTIERDGENLIAIGDKDQHEWWYPAESLEYISGRLIRCDIKIV